MIFIRLLNIIDLELLIKYYYVLLKNTDIPGLIAGASDGVGLGVRFLGHVERCAVLLHLVDGTSETVVEDYITINQELEKYGGDLANRPRVTALNKIDAIDETELAIKVHELAMSGADVRTGGRATFLDLASH